MSSGLFSKLLGPASVGLSVARAGVGAIQANQTRQRNKGLISQAYARGQERLGLEQTDQRQSATEGLAARGLLNGGAAGGAPHDLGGQAQADLGREQGLARDELAQQYRNALTENKRAGTQGIIGSLIGGAETGMDAYGALSSVRSLRSGGASGAPAVASSTGSTGGLAPQLDHPFTGAFGVDPVDPLGRGAWANPMRTDEFNVYGGH